MSEKQTDPEVEQPPLVVEKWKLKDGTEVTFALCDHDPENMPQVADAVKTNDMLLVEALKHPAGEELATTESMLTSFLQTEDTDPDSRAAFFDTYLAEHDVDITDEDYVLLAHLGGTYMQVHLIDVPAEHPNLDTQEAADEAAGRLTKTVDNLEPVAHARELLAESIRLRAQAFEVRDEFMSQQIEAHIRQNPGSKIGVMIGALHKGVLERLGERVGVEQEQLKGLAEKTRPVFEQESLSVCLAAVLASQEIPAGTLDKALLVSYGLRFDPDNYYYHAADARVSELSPEAVQDVLRQVETALQFDDRNDSVNALQQILSQAIDDGER